MFFGQTGKKSHSVAHLVHKNSSNIPGITIVYFYGGQNFLDWLHFISVVCSLGISRRKFGNEGEEKRKVIELCSSHRGVSLVRQRKRHAFTHACTPELKEKQGSATSSRRCYGAAQEWGGWSRWGLGGGVERVELPVRKCKGVVRVTKSWWDIYADCLFWCEEINIRIFFFFIFHLALLLIRTALRIWCNIYVNFRSAASEMYIFVWTRSGCLCQCEIANDFRAYLVINTEPCSLCVYIYNI